MCEATVRSAEAQRGMRHRPCLRDAHDLVGEPVKEQSLTCGSVSAKGELWSRYCESLTEGILTLAGGKKYQSW